VAGAPPGAPPIPEAELETEVLDDEEEDETSWWPGEFG
jgi:hypothetical protein